MITDEQVIVLGDIVAAMGGPSLRGNPSQVRAKLTRELSASRDVETVRSQRVYTLQEFADEFGMSLSSVNNLIHRHELVRTYLLPGKPVITEGELERWLRTRPTER